jgi:hypothetical protein
MVELIKNLGTSGHTGHTPNKPFNSMENVGTAGAVPPVPVGFDRSQPFRAIGTKNIENKQSITKPVTTVTGGTTIFQDGLDQPGTGEVPAEWHAIVRALSEAEPVEGFSYGRWQDIVDDGRSFLANWGAAAFKIGWTALDLFGVHPTAPGSRFDIMGLIPLHQGGDVIALTAEAATIRRPSRAILTYRRGDQTGAVLLSTISPRGSSGEASAIQ